jgi:hypothetical protein
VNIADLGEAEDAVSRSGWRGGYKLPRAFPEQVRADGGSASDSDSFEQISARK